MKKLTVILLSILLLVSCTGKGSEQKNAKEMKETENTVETVNKTADSQESAKEIPEEKKLFVTPETTEKLPFEEKLIFSTDFVMDGEMTTLTITPDGTICGGKYSASAPRDKLRKNSTDIRGKICLIRRLGENVYELTFNDLYRQYSSEFFTQNEDGLSECETSISEEEKLEGKILTLTLYTPEYNYENRKRIIKNCWYLEYKGQTAKDDLILTTEENTAR